MLTLLVVSLIAVMTLLYETRESGHLTTFGYAVAILTAISFVLGVAAEVHTMREEARQEAEERAKEMAQKQQLGRIETEMKASVRPLLPVALFYTIRHSITADALTREFTGVPGFRSLKSDILKLVGSVRLGGPLGYNSISLEAMESHCVLEGEKLTARIHDTPAFGDSTIRNPVTTTCEFYFATNGTLPKEPTLVLEKTFSSGKPGEVKRIELLDSTIFQDSFVREWTAQSQTGQNWSVADLSGARMKVRFTFLGERGPVSIHDMQVFFGPTSAMHGIHLPASILDSAVFKTDDCKLFTTGNDMAREMFAPYVLEFDCILTEALMDEHFAKVVTR